MIYTVTFTQHWSYEIESKTRDEAEELAYKNFLKDMSYPVAYTMYDEMEINPDYDEEEERFKDDDYNNGI